MWGHAGHRPEVADEVRLVAVAQLRCHVRPADAYLALSALGSLVEPIATDDPLRADTHVIPEAAFQMADAHRRFSRKAIDPEQSWVAGDAPDHLTQLVDDTARSRALPAEPKTSVIERTLSVSTDMGWLRNGRKPPGRNVTPTTRP